jgi:hypothetical protein
MMELTSAAAFYERSMEILDAAGISFLVGGAYAFRAYTGIVRDTKDFDLMLRERDVPAAIEAFRRAGFRAEIVFPHWIAKAHHGEAFLDIIFNSGNGLCRVDDEWFQHGRSARVLGREAMLCPPEEIIWQKAYIMERERFDGADVAHLVRCCKDTLDWERLLRRFGADGPVLFAHMVLVRFIYPGEPDLVPSWVIERLASAGVPSTSERVCNGTLLSREQYLPDIERWGHADARLLRAALTENDARIWTAAISNANSARG